MQDGQHVVGFRRAEDWRGLSRVLKGRWAYEVHLSDGTVRRVSWRELYDLVDGHRIPADFWACVHAADTAWERLGDHERPELTVWPEVVPDPAHLERQEVTGLLHGLLIRLEDRLPAKDLTLITEFIDVGELELALEQMADQLSEYEQPLSDAERNDVVALAARMRMGDRVPRALDLCPEREC